MKLWFFASVFALASLLSSQAQVAIHPTTTLRELTANNTSASSSYSPGISGNASPGNVSKLPLRSLLYSGATTRIYAHLMGWFGGPGHISVGYTSSDPAQIRSQIEDMISRGVNGVIASWDTNAMIQQTVPLVLREAERHAGFEFAIEFEEYGYRKYADTVGCDITQKVIDDLTQSSTQFENSASYMRINGRPVVFFFGLEKYYVDWARVRAEAPGQPLFLFRNSGAFANTYSDGGFAWSDQSKTDPYDEMLGYLDGFYKAAVAAHGKLAFGSAYGGFNDALAGWGADKITDRHCGQTWLDSFARAANFYSSSQQLPALRLVTWNDYEEGTAIEPGVDNCVAVSAGLSGSALRWSITGNTNTLDHFSVYVSIDGENLMPLQDVGPSVHSLDLASLGFSPGSYVLYVRAVAKAGILNKISGPVRFVPGNQPPIAALSISTASGTAPLAVSASTTGSSDPDGTLASSTIDFGDGAVVAGPSAQHTYSTPGTYTLQATVYDNAGVASSAIQQVVVNPVSPGVTIASPGQGITQPSPVEVRASVASSQPIKNLSIYVDGVRLFTTFASQADRKFEFKDGSHTIEVRATNISGTVLSAVRNLTTQTPDLPPSAVLEVTPFSGSAPRQVLACTAASSDPDDSIASYLVDFGDGTSGSGISLVHTYQNSGTYQVQATVTDGRGISSTSVQTVTVESATNSGSSPSFRLSAAPQAPSVSSAGPATYIVQATSLNGAFSAEVALSCSGLPSGIACSFDPARITPGASGGTSTLTIGPLQSASGTRWWMPVSVLWLPVFGMALLENGRSRRRQLPIRLLFLLVLVAALVIFGTACGGGISTPSSQKSGGTFNITVLGTSGSLQSSTTVQYTTQ